MNASALKVRDCSNEMILATERDCSVYETIRWLDEYGVDQAIVVDGGRSSSIVLGIVYRQALAAAMMSRSDYDDLSLEDLMDDAPVVVNEHDDLDVALEKFDGSGRDTAIVINSDGEMVGLLAKAKIAPIEDSSNLASAA